MGIRQKRLAAATTYWLWHERPSAGRAAGDGPVEFDAWLDDLCRTRAVVLVVDDPLYVREDHALASTANQLEHRLGQPTSPENVPDHIRTTGAAIVCTAGSYLLVEPEPTNTG